MTTIAEALRAATDTLRPATPTPRLDAELLLAHVLRTSRTRLLAELRSPFGPAEQGAFARLLARRLDLEPIAYLTGQREFYGLELFVTADTLVPRPETELLVELALADLRRSGGRRLTVADIGTGSGAIAVALAVNAPEAVITAVDLSAAALAVAAQNAERHGVGQQISLVQADLLAGVEGPFDLIVSNPPYTLLPEIDAGVRRHEPHLALDGGPDGLAVYRRLVPQAAERLAAGGVLLLEIGATQGPAVSALVAAALPGAQIAVQRDLAGHERVVVAQTERRPDWAAAHH